MCARRTGLSRSTVSSVVAALQAEGLVVDREDDGRAAPSGRRPPAMIALDPTAGFALGLDFGKRHLAVALADLSHDVLAEEWHVMPDDYEADAAIERAAELVDVVLGLRRGPRPRHRSAWGCLGRCTARGWSARPRSSRAGRHARRAYARDRLELRVWLGNDANLRAGGGLGGGARPRPSSTSSSPPASAPAS